MTGDLYISITLAEPVVVAPSRPAAPVVTAEARVGVLRGATAGQAK